MAKLLAAYASHPTPYPLHEPVFTLPATASGSGYDADEASGQSSFSQLVCGLEGSEATVRPLAIAVDRAVSEHDRVAHGGWGGASSDQGGSGGGLSVSSSSTSSSCPLTLQGTRAVRQMLLATSDTPPQALYSLDLVTLCNKLRCT